MHIDSSTYTTPDGRTYTRHLLRESYRQGGKVLRRTLATSRTWNRSVWRPCAVWVRGRQAFTAVPQPRDPTQALLSAAGIDLAARQPAARRTGPGPDTRRRLPAQRRPRRVRKAAVDANGSAAAEP